MTDLIVVVVVIAVIPATLASILGLMYAIHNRGRVSELQLEVELLKSELLKSERVG